MTVNLSKTLKLHRVPIFGPWWQMIQALPLPEPENSIPLRILTQALVIVGIGATDIAAGTQMSFWAVPFSVIGSFWSWLRRHDRNVPTKFALAIGMLVSLAAFFVQLFGERQLNDTRLVLAELLIQLQVLHSFDQPRRKDLGYSMVIGLILLGVASTLSQTMSFGVMLLLFLAIGLPVLVLDYRSRLGLATPFTFKKKAKKTEKQPTSLSILPLTFLLTLVLGLAIFILFPRLPGYQIRSFPMSAPIELRGEFDNRQILNPGYVREGEPGQGQGQGPGQGQGGQGPGRVDDTFYYGFNNQMNQNLRGEMKPKVVLRVRSQAEGFWRVLAFDRYTGQGWEISRERQTETINRPPWSYQFFLPRPISLNRTREVIQTYTAVSELPNLIPALPQARELYFPTRQVAIDPEGALRSPVGLQEGLTYTVISDVPYRNRSVLQKAHSNFPAKDNPYLEIPPKIAAKVRQQTEAILGTSPKPITSPYEKALYIAQYLKQRYSIEPNLPFLEPEEDLVEAFLFKYKGGYPDHFSTALTVMLRSIGISARLVAGFGPGEFNPFTGLYVVKNTDAYAITEVYFHKYGWFAFDPIPGHELIPPSIEENQTFTALQQFWKWVAGWLPSPVASVLNRLMGLAVIWLGRAIGWLVGLLSQGWIGIFIGLILATALAFLGWLSWQFWQRWRYQRWLNRLPAMESLYRQMLDRLAEQGFRKHPTQTPLEYVQQSWDSQPGDRARIIQEISQAYVSWRYGGKTPDLAVLRQRLRELRQQKQKPKSGASAVRAT